MIPPSVTPVSIGRSTRTPCASSTARAGRSSSSTSTHSADGLRELCRRVAARRRTRVAIERPDGPVVDAVLEAGLEVVVVSSRSVKALRERYGTSGNKSDRSDAYVLADCLRTDGHRWRPASSPTRRPRSRCAAHVRARKDLVETPRRGRQPAARPPAHRVPRRVGLFSDIDSPISLRFLERFPSATRAGWLSEKRLGDLAARQRLQRPQGPRRTPRPPDRGTRRPDRRRRRRPRRDHPRLRHRAQDTARPDRRAQHPPRRTPRRPSRRPHLPVPAPLRHRPRRHPARRDRRLPRPIPRPRIARLPRRCRPLHPSQRPTPRRHLPLEQRQETPTTPSATSPATAGEATTGPNTATDELRADGKTHPHAERILARSWTHIIWRCWQDNTTYDPDRHGGHQRLTEAAA